MSAFLWCRPLEREMADIRLYSFIVVVLLFPFGDSSTHGGKRFEGHPDGVDNDDNYRIKVTRGEEVINSTLTQGGHYRTITLTLSAFNSVFILDLQLNTYLFAAGYVERSFSKDGVIYHQTNHTEGHCYYLGKVRDHPFSSAAVSTCKGIVGYFTIGNVSYHIEPAGSQLHGPHKVYRNRGDAKTAYRCGYTGGSLGSLMNSENHRRRQKRFIWPQGLDNKNKVVELYVANDVSQFESLKTDVDAVIRRTKNIVNIASAGYQPLGIYIVLVGVEVWSTDNKITVDFSNSSNTLDLWAYYRMTKINPIHYNDNGVLITNKRFDANGRTTVIGKAYRGTMCSNRLSVALVADTDIWASAAGSTMDHELGHSFGLDHDEEIPSCFCSAPNEECVMGSNSNPTFTWSQCSLDQFAYSFEHGSDICLYNIPQTIEPNNVLCGNGLEPNNVLCGNGLVEDGEQCDCGNSTNQECNRTCCNSTCQLEAPATCAYGRCCNINTCQILPCGTLCLGKADPSCDLEEFCNGQNHLCPNDTHLPDGANCTVNDTSAYCYNGQCRSRESQCELLWGPGTLVSIDRCYRRNEVGDSFFNCGINWYPNVTYRPCPKSDVMCGTLQCQDFNRTLYYFVNNNITHVYYMYYNGGKDTCHNVRFDFGLNIKDPGYVPSGAACGAGKMCLNQECVNVSSLNTIPCIVSCQANEVCNNLGQCQSTIASCPQSTTNPTTPSAQTLGIILGTVLGALGLALTSVLLYTYLKNRSPVFSLFVNAEATTERTSQTVIR